MVVIILLTLLIEDVAKDGFVSANGAALTAGMPQDDLALPKLSRPLSIPCATSDSLDAIEPERRRVLKEKRHFLLRGTGWIKNLGIGVTLFHNSKQREVALSRLRQLSGEWDRFCSDWEVDPTPHLGKALISNYLAYNERNNRNRLTEPEARFLTYYRAAGLYAFFYFFLKEWFADKREGKERHARFLQKYGTAYYSGFLCEHMQIEPVIYKLGSLSDDDFASLFGTKDRKAYQTKNIKPELVNAFRERIDLLWDDRAVTPERVIEEIFVEERCSTYEFMADVSHVVRDVLHLHAAPRIWHETSFHGPDDGIVIEPYVDIRVLPKPWPPEIAGR